MGNGINSGFGGGGGLGNGINGGDNSGVNSGVNLGNSPTRTYQPEAPTMPPEAQAAALILNTEQLKEDGNPAFRIMPPPPPAP
jgi:hypothetical protein